MNASDYQAQAARTLLTSPGFPITDEQIMIIWCAIGLSGEAGEVSELVKKGILHQHGLDIHKLEKELGDVLWYAAGLATALKLDLGQIMRDNINKLCQRYPEGYSAADSVHRADLDGASEVVHVDTEEERQNRAVR